MVPPVGNGLNRASTWSEWRCSFPLFCLQNCVRSTNQTSEHVLCAAIIQIWSLFFRFMRLANEKSHLFTEEREANIFLVGRGGDMSIPRTFWVADYLQSP